MSIRGHLWTIAPRLRHGVRPLRPPEPRPWRTTVTDPVTGEIPVTGLLREVPGSEDLLVLVHGLGGSTSSHYMLRAAMAAEAAGISCLRVNLRGCDRESGDFYHGGLTADLHAALASDSLRGYRRIYALGYSLGGHVALRLGTEEADPRLAAVAAVCSPLDLRLSQQAIDAPAVWVYRRYLLSSLKVIYAAVAQRRPVPVPAAEAARIGTLFEFDDRIVAPRFGFAGALDYYARASVAPRLADLRVPALLLNSEADPMVPAHTVRTALERGASSLEVRWLSQGGHVSFPGELDAGLGVGVGVDAQVIGWLRGAAT
ncbi:MAG TPA: alpha/beta fold hydrolase [Thermoanaerobaculia bacterium]|nr:alpha/beta fold hydrolase [Thermoanaerobaculia bacterium]